MGTRMSVDETLVEQQKSMQRLLRSLQRTVRDEEETVAAHRAIVLQATKRGDTYRARESAKAVVKRTATLRRVTHLADSVQHMYDSVQQARTRVAITQCMARVARTLARVNATVDLQSFALATRQFAQDTMQLNAKVGLTTDALDMADADADADRSDDADADALDDEATQVDAILQEAQERCDLALQEDFPGVAGARRSPRGAIKV